MADNTASHMHGNADDVHELEVCLVSPGEILSEEFMKPLGMSQAELARRSGLAPQAISDIVKGQRKLTVESAKKIAGVFSVSPMLLLNLQATYELRRSTLNQTTSPRLVDALAPSPELPAVDEPLSMPTGPRGRLPKL